MRTRLVLLLAFGLLLLTRSGSACLWTYATTLDGVVEEIVSVSPGLFAERLIQRQPHDYWLERLGELKQQSAKEPGNHKLRNDYAVMLARAGEPSSQSPRDLVFAGSLDGFGTERLVAAPSSPQTSHCDESLLTGFRSFPCCSVRKFKLSE